MIAQLDRQLFQGPANTRMWRRNPRQEVRRDEHGAAGPAAGREIASIATHAPPVWFPVTRTVDVARAHVGRPRLRPGAVQRRTAGAAPGTSPSAVRLLLVTSRGCRRSAATTVPVGYRRTDRAMRSPAPTRAPGTDRAARGAQRRRSPGPSLVRTGAAAHSTPSRASWVRPRSHADPARRHIPATPYPVTRARAIAEVSGRRDLAPRASRCSHRSTAKKLSQSRSA